MPVVHLPRNCEYCGIAMRYDNNRDDVFVCSNGHPPHRVFVDGAECACQKCHETRSQNSAAEER